MTSLNKPYFIHFALLFLSLTACKKYKQELNVNWRDLNTTQYTIKYLQHNFNNVPIDTTVDLSVADFAESGDLATLDSADVSALVQLISDSTNFSEGDCGTFALNAGVIVFRDETIRGMVSIGCGYNQWNFKPFNPNCNWGSLNQKGFEKMSDMLDAINTKNAKLK